MRRRIRHPHVRSNLNKNQCPVKPIDIIPQSTFKQFKTHLGRDRDREMEREMERDFFSKTNEMRSRILNPKILKVIDMRKRVSGSILSNGFTHLKKINQVPIKLPYTKYFYWKEYTGCVMNAALELFHREFGVQLNKSTRIIFQRQVKVTRSLSLLSVTNDKVSQFASIWSDTLPFLKHGAPSGAPECHWICNLSIKGNN